MVVSKSICSLFFVLFFGLQAVSQEVSIQKRTPIESAFAKVSKVYRVNFAYNPNTIDQNDVIRQDFTISSPHELLERILPEGFSWKYIGNTMVISKVKNTMRATPFGEKIRKVQELDPISKTPSSKKRGIVTFSLEHLDKISRIISGVKTPHPPNELVIKQRVEAISINTKEAPIHQEKIGWTYQPYLSFFNYRQMGDEKEASSDLYGMGAGGIVSAHKSRWYLSASASYNQTSNNLLHITKDSIVTIDSAQIRVDTIRMTTAVENVKYFVRYTASIGYHFYQSSSLIIPIEFGLSIFQMLKVTDEYNKFLYNSYLAVPIELIRKKKSFVVTPFVEVGISDDLKQATSKNKRVLFGLSAGLHF